MFIPIFLISSILSANGQQQNRMSPIIYTCDTSDAYLLKIDRSKTKKIKSSPLKSFLHINVETSGNELSYSFFYWIKKGKVKNKLSIEIPASTIKPTKIIEIDSIYYYAINIDSLFKVVQKISKIKADTSIVLAYDRLYFFEFYHNGKYIPFKFCETQLAWSNKKDIEYFEKIIFDLKKNATQLSR